MLPVDKIRRTNHLAWYSHEMRLQILVNMEQLEATEDELLRLFDYSPPSYEARCVSDIVYHGD